MNSKIVGNDECKSSEPVASSVCHVCQGIGDLSNPRGFCESLEWKEQRDWPGVDKHCEYIYIYVHHANFMVLLASAEAGCDVCAVLCNSLREHIDNDPETAAALYATPQMSKQPESVARIVPMDDDIQSATQFAEVMRQDRAFTKDRLEDYNNGRVVLLFRCDNESGPRACSSSLPRVARLWALTTPLLKSRYIYRIKSPCESHLQ